MGQFRETADELEEVHTENEKKFRAFMKECGIYPSANAQLSTVHSNYPVENCLDGNPSTFCQNKESEQNPFLVLEYDSVISVREVVVTNRADCCGERTKNMFVTVTDKMPVQGAIAEGEILGSFTGPGNNGQVI